MYMNYITGSYIKLDHRFTKLAVAAAAAAAAAAADEEHPPQHPPQLRDDPGGPRGPG